MEPFIGEIRMVGFNYAPVGWALANGALLPISEYSALYALYGTTYGGDGRQTFALPDLRGRAPINFGTGPGLPTYAIGQAGGAPAVTLHESQMPAHKHAVNAVGGRGSANSADPIGHLWAQASSGQIYSDAASTGEMNGNATSNTGGSQPHENMPPYLAINFCVALVGVWPSRP